VKESSPPLPSRTAAARPPTASKLSVEGLKETAGAMTTGCEPERSTLGASPPVASKKLRAFSWLELKMP
jgi:hypothetical protein